MKALDSRPETYVAHLRCDRCGAEAHHDIGDGFNNFLQIEFDAAWGSAIGDGTHVEIDLCHGCLKEALGPWLRTSTSAWAVSPGVRASEDFMSNVEKLPVQERGDPDTRGSD